MAQAPHNPAPFPLLLQYSLVAQGPIKDQTIQTHTNVTGDVEGRADALGDGIPDAEAQETGDSLGRGGVVPQSSGVGMQRPREGGLRRL